MLNKMYLHLFHLVLLVLFPQGIIGTFLEDHIGESSNVLVREKRVISRNPDEDVPVRAGAMPYVVNIKNTENYMVGVGSILSVRTVITATRTVLLDASQYIVTSASNYVTRGVVHNVTNIQIHLTDLNRPESGIALVYVNPPFAHRYSGSIGLHSGPILAGMHGVVVGWASSLFGGRKETRCPGRLRQITVPILNHRQCVNIYQGIFNIKDDNVCTHHHQKQCGRTDVGAPLILDNELAGVHIGIIATPNTLAIKPDVFVLLQHLDYIQWIRSHIVH